MKTTHARGSMLQPRRVDGLPRRRTGRRSLLLNPQVRKSILDAVTAGAFDHVAAESAGVSVATFGEWLARGEGRDPDRPADALYAAFAEEVRVARAAARRPRKPTSTSTIASSGCGAAPGVTSPGVGDVQCRR